VQKLPPSLEEPGYVDGGVPNWLNWIGIIVWVIAFIICIVDVIFWMIKYA
jgi:hypothetical protein